MLDYLKFSGIYFCIMLAMLVMVWPGYFVSDEYIMLWGSTLWTTTSAYHFLMMLELILGQMLIPGAVGVELLQICLISAIVGYVIQQIANRLPKTKWIYLLYIPMMFPAVLLNNLQLQKGMPGTYLEVLLLCKVTCALLDHRKLTLRDAVEWVLLTAVTYTHRMDGFYYIFAAPVLFWLLFFKQAKKRLLIGLVAGILVCGTALQHMQNAGSGAFYTMVNYNRLVYAPLKAADPVEDAAELATIGQIFDVEAFRNADCPSQAVGTIPVSVYSAEIDENILSAYKSAVMKLMIKYPLAYIHQQLERFLLSSGYAAYLDGHITYNGQIIKDRNPDAEMVDADNYQNPDIAAFRSGSIEAWHLNEYQANPLNASLNQKLRVRTILFCMGRDLENFKAYSVRNVLFNNLIPCILMLLALWVYLFVKKQYELWGILTLFMLRIPILIGSASYVSFQYYLRFFVVGNAIPFFFAIRHLAGRNARLMEKSAR